MSANEVVKKVVEVQNAIKEIPRKDIAYPYGFMMEVIKVMNLIGKEELVIDLCDVVLKDIKKAL